MGLGEEAWIAELGTDCRRLYEGRRSGIEQVCWRRLCMFGLGLDMFGLGRDVPGDVNSDRKVLQSAGLFKSNISKVSQEKAFHTLVKTLYSQLSVF